MIAKFGSKKTAILPKSVNWNRSGSLVVPESLREKLRHSGIVAREATSFRNRCARSFVIPELLRRCATISGIQKYIPWIPDKCFAFSGMTVLFSPSFRNRCARSFVIPELLRRCATISGIQKYILWIPDKCFAFSGMTVLFFLVILESSAAQSSESRRRRDIRVSSNTSKYPESRESNNILI